MRVGVYPGTFNPPTIAHLAIASAARRQHALDRVVLMLSRAPINKEHIERPTLDERVSVLLDDARGHPWLTVATTELRLLADIASGFDVLIMGADKWAQVNDEQYYASAEACRAAVARLPVLAIAPRPPFAVPPEHALDVPPDLADISSTGARAGNHAIMTAAARASGLWAAATG